MVSLDCTAPEGRWSELCRTREACCCPRMQATCCQCTPRYRLDASGQFILAVARLEGAWPALSDAEQADLLAELVPLGRIASERAARHRIAPKVTVPCIGRVTA